MTGWVDPQEPGMPEPEIRYFADGKTVQYVSYKDHAGELHRKDGPAMIEWYSDGVRKIEDWLIHGVYSKTDGPSIIKWHENGQVEREAWFQDGALHKDVDPADIYWNADGTLSQEHWYQNGQPVLQDTDKLLREQYHARFWYPGTDTFARMIKQSGQIRSIDR